MGATAKKVEVGANTQKSADVVPIRTEASMGHNGGPEWTAEPEIRMMIETDADAAAEVADMPAIEAKTIRHASCQLLVAVHYKEDPVDGWKVGFSFNAIEARLRQLFPGCTTNHNSLRWYLMRLRTQEGKFKQYDLPTRFKRPKSKSKPKQKR